MIFFFPQYKMTIGVKIQVRYVWLRLSKDAGEEGEAIYRLD